MAWAPLLKMLEDTEATRFPAIHMNVMNSLLNNDQFLGFSGSLGSLKVGWLVVPDGSVSSSLVVELAGGVAFSISCAAAILTAYVVGFLFFTGSITCVHDVRVPVGDPYSI